jgi:peptide methionine sulfoxide reductase MsrB
MIEGTMKCYKCGKRSYDDNACLDEETGLPCWRSPAEEDGWEICKP